MTTPQRRPYIRPRDDPQAHHPPYRSWEQLKQDRVWVRYNLGYTDRLLWHLNGGAFPESVFVSSAPNREENLAPLFTPASGDHQSDGSDGGTWHEIAKLPMTKPPVSSIDVSCHDLEYMESSWVQIHLELCNESRREYASFQDVSRLYNDEDGQGRRPIANVNELDGRREADQDTRYLMRCCGQDRPVGKSGLKLTVASSSPDEYVSIGDYVSAVHAWLTEHYDDIMYAKGPEVDPKMAIMNPRSVDWLVTRGPMHESIPKSFWGDGNKTVPV